MKEVVDWFQLHSAIIQAFSSVIIVFVTWHYVRLTKYLAYSQDEPYVLAKLTYNMKKMPAILSIGINNLGVRPALAVFVEIIYPDKRKQYFKVEYVIPEKANKTSRIKINCTDDNIPQLINLFYSYGIYVVKMAYDFRTNTHKLSRLNLLNKKWFINKSNKLYFENQIN